MTACKYAVFYPSYPHSMLSSRREHIVSQQQPITNMTSPYDLPTRIETLLGTYEYDGTPIWRLSEGKNGVIKLELTWQPPTQQKQHMRLQKKTPGKKEEGESGHSAGIHPSAKTAPPADEWPRQPNPVRTPPNPAPPAQTTPKTPAKSPTIEMVSPPRTPDITPPPGTRWTPKTPPKSPPSQIHEEDVEEEDPFDPFYGFTEDNDRTYHFKNTKSTRFFRQAHQRSAYTTTNYGTYRRLRGNRPTQP